MIKNDIVFITKSNSQKTFSEDEVIKIFGASDDMKKIKKVIENAEDRFYTSWASVETKDKAGELIPIDDIIKQQDILLERNGPISDTHTNRIIGQTKTYKVLEHPKSKTLGVLHLNKIFNHNSLDDKVWKEIQSGERRGSSVGGFNDSVSQGTDPDTGEKVKVLEGFHQFETASVEEPCNPLALNEAVSVVAKSNKSSVNKLDELDAKYNQSSVNKLEELDAKYNKKGGPGSGRKPEGGESEYNVDSRVLVPHGVNGTVVDVQPDGKRIIEVDDGSKIVVEPQHLKPPKVKKKLPDEQVIEDHRIGIEKKPDGPHDHDEENPEGIHEHPELEEKEDKDYEGKPKKSKTNINKKNIEHFNKNKKGDNMSDDIKKDVSAILKLLKKQDARLTKLEKQGEEKPEDVEETEDEETVEEKKKTKKQEETEEEKEDDEETVEDKKKTKKTKKEGEEETEEEKEDEEEEKEDDEETVEEKKKTKKEEAASDIEGLEDAEQPESPDPESPNDEDVFKSKAGIKKMIKNEVRKVMTPLPMGASDVTKEEKYANLPLDLATGKKRMNHVLVNKAFKEHVSRIGGDSE